MKQIISILIILSISVMSCKKENTENRPQTSSFDTTGYFRFSDSTNGYYCFSRLSQSSYAGKINVTIKSGNDSSNVVTIFSMPELGGGITSLEDYDDFQYHENYPYADAWINGHHYKSELGSWVRKTGLFSFDFSIKFDNLTHRLTGYGSY